MNYDSMWDCVMALDFAEQNGDRPYDAIYNRNRKVEEKLGFKMNEVNQNYIGWFEAGNSTECISPGTDVISGRHADDKRPALCRHESASSDVA